MKQNRLISIGAFILVLALSGLMTGCMEKDVYDPNREKEPLPDPDKYFGFEMRSDVRLSVNYDIYGFTPLISNHNYLSTMFFETHLYGCSHKTLTMLRSECLCTHSSIPKSSYH